MKNLVYTFQISGQITDLRSRENKPYEDYELLNYLNREKYAIEDRIKDKVLYELNKSQIDTRSVSIQLNFKKGSILTDGYSILEIMATIGGSISLIEFIVRVLRSSIERAIQNFLNSNNNSNYTVSINVIPKVIPQADANHTSIPNQPIIFGVSFSKFLFYITLINFAFFIGGSLFNVIQIPSILEKQEEARMKFSEATQKLESANRLLSDAKLTYNLNSTELQEIKNRVLNQSEEIEKEFNTEVGLIDSEISKLENRINKSQLRLDDVNNQIKTLQEQNKKFGFFEVWNNVNLFLKI